MQAQLVAAFTSAACLLSACGFVPPAPPMPDNAPRVAINQVDPRLLMAGQPDGAQSPPVEQIKLTLAPPTERPHAATTPSDAATVSENVEGSPAIPVPQAPPIGNAKAPAAAGQADPVKSPPTATNPLAPMEGEAPAHGSDPIKVSSTILLTEAQSELPSGPSEAPGPVTSTEPAPQPESLIAKEVWRISPEDGTVRQALGRWAAKAGWTFGADQWELNFDLPIQAPAEFEAATFQEATQALSQAIAMTESPVRPCFYANRVLRVIPFTRSCNRAPNPSPQS